MNILFKVIKKQTNKQKQNLIAKTSKVKTCKFVSLLKVLEKTMLILFIVLENGGNHFYFIYLFLFIYLFFLPLCFFVFFSASPKFVIFSQLKSYQKSWKGCDQIQSLKKSYASRYAFFTSTAIMINMRRLSMQVTIGYWDGTSDVGSWDTTFFPSIKGTWPDNFGK